MADRPAWTKTNVPWERKVAIWGRMTKGDKLIQIGRWLDEEGYHLDQKTIGQVRAELNDLPEGGAKDLPESIRESESAG